MYYVDNRNLINFTPVANSFIDKYAGNIESTYIVAYIYILRCSVGGRLPAAGELAERFAITKESAEKIITYWDSQGMFDKPARPSYTPTDIAKLSTANSEISGLISTASAILGKALGQKEQSTILSLYDYYRLPIDVITILLGHCAETNHTNISYIERIASDWAEKGIETSEDAENYLKLYYGDFNKVLKCFGITGRLANSKERKYMEKWLAEFKLPLELVTEACENAVINTGKASWKYADTVLCDWHKNNITTLEQAKEFTERHKPKPKTVKKPQAVKPVRVSANKFNNFEEREYDESELNSLALELLKEQNNDA